MKFKYLPICVFLCSLGEYASGTTTKILPDNSIVNVNLAAGLYDIKAISGGWNAWGGQTNPPETGWLGSFEIVSIGGDVVASTGSGPTQTPGSAIALAPPIEITVPADQLVGFRTTDDPRFLSDNVGSLTIAITRIDPDPDINDTLFGDDNGSNFESFIKSLKQYEPLIVNPIKTWLETGNLQDFIISLGEHIEGSFSSAISRVGGVLTQLGIGALDPEVAGGVSALWESANEENPDTRGLWNPNTRKAIEEIFRDEENFSGQRNPIQPESVDPDGGASFDTDVPGGSLILFDPAVSTGIIYESDSDLNFQSVVLPYLGDQQGTYLIQTFVDGEWVDFVEATPLHEYFFDEAVDIFRVIGISPDIDPGTEWISALSFDKEGRFLGSISPTSVVPIPMPLVFFVPAIASLFMFRKARST